MTNDFNKTENDSTNSRNEKRFELIPNLQGQVDIIDYVESDEKNAICIYNDLGVLPFTSAPSLCDLLNEQHETIERLKQNIDELLSVNVEEDLLKENEYLKKRLKETLDELYCKDRVLEEKGISVECCDKNE